MQGLIFIPELAFIAVSLIFFFMSLGKPARSTVQNTAIILAGFLVLASLVGLGEKGSLFYDAYQIDAYSQIFKVIISIGLFLVIFMGYGLSGIDKKLQPEYFMFLTISSMGLIFLSSSVEIITMVLSLEISSFALYVVIPFRKKEGYRSQMESGIKYVLFGAVSSGISLYGSSYLYGSCGTTYFSQLAKILPGIIATSPMAMIGLIMLMSGFFFKLAMFPMHFWTPDVYEGAANETTGFVATLPKLGAIAILLRLAAFAGLERPEFVKVLMILSFFSMTIGNLSALVQTDIKRLAAYSSIAHAGYLMIGILTLSTSGFSAAIYYGAGYVLMNVALFYVIYNVASDGENVTFDSLKGLYKKSPLLAMTLAVSALALAGIPPTVGFTGKFLLFTSAIQKKYYAIVILAVINAGIAGFYYLKLIRAAYTTTEDEVEKTVLPLSSYCLGCFLIIGIVLIGVLPQSVIEMALKAVETLI